jgi:excisionase family DNA binding protein
MPLDEDLVERIADAVVARLRTESVAPIDPRWLSVEQAANYAALSVESLRRLLAAGKLTAYRPRPGRVLIDRRELDALILGSTRRPTGGRGRYPRNGEFGESE